MANFTLYDPMTPNTETLAYTDTVYVLYRVFRLYKMYDLLSAAYM